MQEIAETILNYGGTVILAVLFVYIFIEDRKDKKEEKKNNAQILKELATSNNNISESLNLLKISIDNNTIEFKEHDEKAVQQFHNMNEKLIKIEHKLEGKG